MNQRANEVTFRGQVENRDTAFELLSKPGDVAIVNRGRPRLLIMRCPCGCGDDLLINLDYRAGPAWDLYGIKQLSLYPSYWRDSACGSHFILWRNRIYWCSGWETEESDEWRVPTETEEMVLAALPEDHFTSYQDVARQLDLIPWEVLQACRQLMKLKKVVKKWHKGEYRRMRSRSTTG